METINESKMNNEEFLEYLKKNSSSVYNHPEPAYGNTRVWISYDFSDHKKDESIKELYNNMIKDGLHPESWGNSVLTFEYRDIYGLRIVRDDVIKMMQNVGILDQNKPLETEGVSLYIIYARQFAPVGSINPMQEFNAFTLIQNKVAPYSEKMRNYVQ